MHIMIAAAKRKKFDRGIVPPSPRKFVTAPAVLLNPEKPSSALFWPPKFTAIMELR